jgi:hypothetical protein
MVKCWFSWFSVSCLEEAWSSPWTYQPWSQDTSPAYLLSQLFGVFVPVSHFSNSTNVFHLYWTISYIASQLQAVVSKFNIYVDKINKIRRNTILVRIYLNWILLLISGICFISYLFWSYMSTIIFYENTSTMWYCNIILFRTHLLAWDWVISLLTRASLLFLSISSLVQEDLVTGLFVSATWP